MGILVLRGKEDYLVGKCLEKALSGDNLSVSWTETLNEESLASLSELSLLGDSNVLVWETDTLGAEEKAFSLLKECGTGDGCLVIKAGSVRENTKFWKWLKTEAKIKNCEPLTPVQYENFLREENAARGNFMSEPVLSAFEERSRYGTPGVDLSMVDKWLSELWVLSRTGAQITEEDVVSVVRVDDVNTAFELIGYLSRHDMAGLFNAASRVKEDAMMVLGALLWSLRILSKLKLAPSHEVGISPYQTKSLSALMKISGGDVDRMVDAVTEGTVMIKYGISDEEAMTHVLSKLGEIVMTYC